MATATARDRLLEAADDLFYRVGVQTVGIDRVIEQAGVAKASLYNTFGSKEALVEAYLEGRRVRITDRITRHVAAYDAAPRPDPRRLRGARRDGRRSPAYRGLRVRAGLRRGPVGRPGRARRRELPLLGPDPVHRPRPRRPAPPTRALLARQLHLLYDGTSQAVRMDRNLVGGRRGARGRVGAARRVRSS